MLLSRKSLAGPAGIEPALKVLETSVLPLYEGPRFIQKHGIWRQAFWQL